MDTQKKRSHLPLSVLTAHIPAEIADKFSGCLLCLSHLASFESVLSQSARTQADSVYSSDKP